jgi:hypothetical protein
LIAGRPGWLLKLSGIVCLVWLGPCRAKEEVMAKMQADFPKADGKRST